MNLIIKNLEGRKLSSLMAIYFRGVDGTVSKPMSVIVPTFDEEWLELGTDGCGKIRISSSFWGRFFYDAALGYSFLAPLMIAMGDEFDGNELFSKVDWTENEAMTIIRLSTLHGRSFAIRFEDDEVFIYFDY
jgi:hypothetical protein